MKKFTNLLILLLFISCSPINRKTEIYYHKNGQVNKVKKTNKLEKNINNYIKTSKDILKLILMSDFEEKELKKVKYIEILYKKTNNIFIDGSFKIGIKRILIPLEGERSGLVILYTETGNINPPLSKKKTTKEIIENIEIQK